MSAGKDRPDVATLADWVEGRLPGGQAERVAEAIRLGDPRVRMTVAWLRGFLDAAGALPLYEPPPIVRQNLRRAFDRWSAGREPEPAPIPAAFRLSFDSRRDLATAGVRAAGGTEDTYHLAFTGELADVVVDVRRAGTGLVDLDGQVLPLEPGTPPIFAASLTGPGFAARSVDGDELGRFHLTKVPQRVLELRLTNGDTEIVATLDLTANP